MATYALRIESSLAKRRSFSARCSGVTSGKLAPSTGGVISKSNVYASPPFLSKTKFKVSSLPKDNLKKPNAPPAEAHTNISPLPAVNDARPSVPVYLVATV